MIVAAHLTREIVTKYIPFKKLFSKIGQQSFLKSKYDDGRSISDDGE